MKIWISSTITAMGFILGLVLAGAGGLSAKTLNLLKGSESNSENTKQIEKYWFETGLSFQDVRHLVSNDKCYSSEKYFNACLNSVIESSLGYNLKLSPENGGLVKIHNSERLDEKSEKELLELYFKKIEHVDFDNILAQLINLESESKRPMLAARMINSFLSVYFDPHTYIMPASFYDEVGSKIERSKFFIGISYEKTDGEFYIRKVFKNSDAEISGLKVNDKVLTINSVNLDGAQYNDMSNQLKNEKLSIVKFKIKRKNKILDIVVKRSYRKLSHVQYNTVSNDKNYGLITLTKFNPGVCADIAKILKNVKKNKIAGLILDLRDNPGGLLDEASCVAGLFLGKNKKAYYVEYFDEAKANEVVLTSEEQAYSGPLVALVNSASASASELLAGGLQEYRRALVIGERTFGKGTFQEPEEWVMNSKISLFKTQGLYLLPSRNSTQLVGVNPDVELHVESAPVKREGREFFNPIAGSFKKYAKLKNFEKEQKFNRIYTRNVCKKTDSEVFEDLYLQQSLSYLDCVQYADSAIAQQSEGAQIN